MEEKKCYCPEVLRCDSKTKLLWFGIFFANICLRWKCFLDIPAQVKREISGHFQLATENWLQFYEVKATVDL